VKGSRGNQKEEEAMFLLRDGMSRGVNGASGALAENQTLKDWIAVSEEGFWRLNDAQIISV